jgi:Phosphotransferase enzyme family
MQERVAGRRLDLSPTRWVDYFRSLGYRDSQFLAGGMEGLVFRLGDGSVAKVWSNKPLREVEWLKVFYSELAQNSLPFATPEIREVAQIEASVVSIERELRGMPMQPSAVGESSRVAPPVVDCLIKVLQGLASVPGSAKLAGLPVLGESEVLCATQASWRETLAGLLQRRAAQFGRQLREAITGFDRQLERILILLDTVTPRPPSVIHGDLVPPNILVDERGQPTAVVDFGFFSTIGDPAFDAAVAASTFDMYGTYASRTDDELTQEMALTLGYLPEELTLYKAAYAVATSNAYDPNGRDGHFAWCARMLRRKDVVDLLLG